MVETNGRIASFQPVMSEDALDDNTPAPGDPQGIPWDRLQLTRERYRTQRLFQYKNYTNVITATMEKYQTLQDFHEAEISDQTVMSHNRQLYRFYRNFPTLKTSIIHFQLRNLLWATSSHDVFAVHSNCIKHWNMITGNTRVVLDLSGSQSGSEPPAVGQVHISTACASNGLVAAGGFNGEVVVSTQAGKLLWSTRASKSDNCITNGLEIGSSSSGAAAVLAANNDDAMRLLDIAAQRTLRHVELSWPANGASANPVDPKLIAVVGDDQDVHLFDSNSDRAVCSMSGHLDWSFAVSWHPAGNLLATGNQDCTTRVWDTRRPGAALAVLPATMGSIRACRFSPDGASLAVAEPADFVHVYNVTGGLCECQDIDMFGEISGISFSPGDADVLFVGIPDQVYNSTLCFHKVGKDDT